MLTAKSLHSFLQPTFFSCLFSNPLQIRYRHRRENDDDENFIALAPAEDDDFNLEKVLNKDRALPLMHLDSILDVDATNDADVESIAEDTAMDDDDDESEKFNRFFDNGDIVEENRRVMNASGLLIQHQQQSLPSPPPSSSPPPPTPPRQSIDESDNDDGDDNEDEDDYLGNLMQILDRILFPIYYTRFLFFVPCLRVDSILGIGSQ